MNNLLQRLRCANGMNSVLCKKAADEIKRLRAQNKDLEEKLKKALVECDFCGAALTQDNRRPSSKQYDSEEWIEPN